MNDRPRTEFRRRNSRITTGGAKGFSYSDDSSNVKIAVSIAREDFNAVKEKAIRNQWSISEVIREYVKTGIIVDKEMGEWPEEICTVDISRAPTLIKAAGM